MSEEFQKGPLGQILECWRRLTALVRPGMTWVIAPLVFIFVFVVTRATYAQQVELAATAHSISENRFWYRVQPGDDLGSVLYRLDIGPLWGRDGFVLRAVHMNQGRVSDNGDLPPVGEWIVLPIPSKSWHPPERYRDSISMSKPPEAPVGLNPTFPVKGRIEPVGPMRVWIEPETHDYFWYKIRLGDTIGDILYSLNISPIWGPGNHRVQVIELNPDRTDDHGNLISPEVWLKIPRPQSDSWAFPSFVQIQYGNEADRLLAEAPQAVINEVSESDESTPGESKSEVSEAAVLVSAPEPEVGEPELSAAPETVETRVAVEAEPEILAEEEPAADVAEPEVAEAVEPEPEVAQAVVPEPVIELSAGTEPKLDVTPIVEVELELEVAPVAELEPEPEMAPVAELEPEPEMAPVAELEPEPEMAPVAELEPEPEPEPEVAPVAELEPAPEVAPTVEPVPEVTQTEVQLEEPRRPAQAEISAESQSLQRPIDQRDLVSLLNSICNGPESANAIAEIQGYCDYLKGKPIVHRQPQAQEILTSNALKKDWGVFEVAPGIFSTTLSGTDLQENASVTLVAESHYSLGIHWNRRMNEDIGLLVNIDASMLSFKAPADFDLENGSGMALSYLAGVRYHFTQKLTMDALIGMKELFFLEGISNEAITMSKGSIPILTGNARYDGLYYGPIALSVELGAYLSAGGSAGELTVEQVLGGYLSIEQRIVLDERNFVGAAFHLNAEQSKTDLSEGDFSSVGGRVFWVWHP